MVNYCRSSKSLIGKTAIVTGANTGIGYEAALEFAKRGGRVILACRNEVKANEAREKMIKATGNENILVKLLDLELLSSVRAFAKDISENEKRLDLLINNGGAIYLPDKISEDGLQVEMAVNYLSHFLLTHLLLDLLKKSAPSRIVNVSSIAAMFGCSLDPNNLNQYGGFFFYARTKLCQIYFTQELGKRLEGTGVTVCSLHPGAIASEFQRDFSTFSRVYFTKFLKTPEEGAQTTIYCALDDAVVQHNGEHFDNCKQVSPYCTARNKEKRKKLWEMSEVMVGLRQKPQKQAF